MRTEDTFRRWWNAPWPWMAIVVVAFCVPLFVGLGQADYENDEAIYSFTVDVMVKSGDWLTPKCIPSETAPFLKKPPLKFWMASLPIRWGLLPANEFGMRFWDALMGGVAFLYIFAIGRRIAGPICGITAVLLLFTHTPLILQHGLRTNNMEAAVFLAYAAGMFHFLAWRSSAPDNRGHVLAIALAFVFAFMTKFVAALFLPLVLGIAVLLKAADRDRLRWQWPTFVLAALVAVVLIAPWFVYQYAVRGSEVFEIMFGAHVVQRFRTYLDPLHVHPWHYYVTELWRQLQASGALILVIAGAALVALRTLRHRWLEGALVVLWFGVPTILMSLGTSKLYHYEYPFLPPVALAGGYAAATAASWLWRYSERPVAALTNWRARSWPRLLTSAPAQIVLTMAGLAGLGVALMTEAFGSLRVTVGGVTLLRNSQIARPFLGGSLLLLAGGSPIALRVVAPLAIALVVMPFAGYRATLAQTRGERHPLRDTQACLRAIADRLSTEGRPAPGVLMEGQGFSHRETYYLYGPGPWQQRDVPSDPVVATHLFARDAYRPVLLSEARFVEFMRDLARDPQAMLARVPGAEPAGVTQLQQVSQADVGIVMLDGATLLLPGPYSACARDRFRPVSR